MDGGSKKIEPHDPLTFEVSTHDIPALPDPDNVTLADASLSEEAPLLVPGATTGGDNTEGAIPQFVPNDPLYNNQWQHHGSAGINVQSVWDDYRGNGVLVALIDDGIDYNHADLAPNYRHDLDWDAAGNDGNSYIQSGDAHGTATAGLIGAAMNGTGTVGVAFEADLAMLRVGFGSGPISQFTTQFRNMRNFDVANNSWSFTSEFADNRTNPVFAGLFAELNNAVTLGRGGLGTVVVFSAGNSRSSGSNTNYHNLQNAPETITVAATDSSGNITYFSTPGASVLVAAPGQSTYTTDNRGSSGYSSGDYTYFSGTSASAPIVSGVVALMLEANPNLGYRDVQEILAYSSRNPKSTSAGWQNNGADNWNGGGLSVSHDYGFGLVDARAAVRLAETWTRQRTASNLVTVSGSNTNNVSINDHVYSTSTINISSPIEIDRVDVHVDIKHTWVGDLTIELISPDGTNSLLANLPINQPLNQYRLIDLDFTFDSVQFWGEDGVGDWTLRIRDNASLDTGYLDDWTLTLIGDAVDNDDTYFFTDEWGRHAVGRGDITDTTGNDTLNFAAITADLDINLTPGSVNSLFGHNITIDNAAIIENIFGGDGDDTLTGNDADNELSGGRGDDTLIGGAGVDIVGYSGNFADYQITDTGFGTHSIVHLGGGRDGTDSLVAVEFAQFDDQLFDLGATSNDPPMPVADIATIGENDTLALDLVANDIDPNGHALTLTAVTQTSGLGTMSLQGGQLFFDPGTDYDYLAFGEQAQAAFSYIVDDGFFGTAQGTGVITIDGANDAPLDFDLLGRHVDENSAGGTLVGTFGSVIDPDANDSHLFELVYGIGPEFELVNGNEIRVAAGADLDFEREPIFTVTAQVRDSRGEIFQRDFTIVLNDVADPIYGTAGNNQLFGGGFGEPIFGLAGDDELRGYGGDDLLTGGEGDDVISGLQGFDTAIFSGDFAEYIVTVDASNFFTVTDTVANRDGTDTVDTVEILRFADQDVSTANTAPIAVADNATTDEDTPVTIDVLANDSDPDVFNDTLSLVSASIVSGGGQVSVQNNQIVFSPNLGNSYDYLAAGDIAVQTIGYTMSDQRGAAATATATVQITGVNDAPHDIGLSNAAVDEHALGGTFIGTISASDIDTGDTHTVSLTDDSGGRFEIVNGNELRVAAGADLDFETVAQHTITARVSDEAGAIFDKNFTVTLNDIVEPIIGTAGDDVLTGGALDDNIFGLGGNDAIDGGGGTDTAHFGGDMAGYTISVINDQVTVADNDPATAGNDGTDTVTNTEALRFTNGDITVGSELPNLDGLNPTGPSFQVNTYTDGNQYGENITALSGGGYVIAWLNRDRWRTDAQIFDKDGIPVGSEFQIETGQGGGFPQLAATSDGGFIALSSTLGQRFTADGQKIGAAFSVPSSSGGKFAALPTGEFMVIWDNHAQDPNGDPVGQVFDSNGNPLSQVFDLTPPAPSRQDVGDVTALSSGNFLTTWTGWHTGPQRGVLARVFDPSGNPVSNLIQVNSDTGASNATSVALQGGGAVIIWENGQIYGRVVDNLGNPLTGTILVTEIGGPHADSSPSVSALDDGGFFVTWRATDGQSSNIYGRQFDAAGNAIGGEFQINADSPDRQLSPEVTTLSDGQVVVTWYTAPDNGFEWDIVARQYSFGSITPGGTLLAATANDDTVNLGAGDEVLDAGAGDDTITGGAGNDTLDGEAGTDSAVYAGNLADYTLTDIGGGSYTVADQVGGRDGTDTLHNFEHLVFADRSVTIGPTSAGPVAAADTAATDQNGGITIDVLANDSDPNPSDTLTLENVSVPANQGLVGITNGELDYDPNGAFDYLAAGQTGTAILTYTVSDGLNIATAAATVTITGLNDAPTGAVIDNASVTENDSGAVIGTLSGIDIDNGDTHSFTVSDARFEVVAGQLKLIDGISLDFEVEPSVTLQVTTTDAAGLSVVSDLTVAVDDILDGTPDADALIGSGADDFFEGGQGQDLVVGGAGDDDLAGGTGVDRLEGGVGDDIYRFNRGDGMDVFFDDYRYDANITHSFSYTRNVAYSRNETRTGSYSSPNHDGEGNIISWTTHRAPVQVVQQGVTQQVETFDTTVTENVQGDGGNDILALGLGISAADILLRASGDDLLVGIKTNAGDTLADITDIIRLQDWNNPDNRIETIRFADSSTMDLTAAAGSLFGGAAVNGLADDAPIAAPNSVVITLPPPAPVNLIGSADHENIIGTDGNDVLAGGAGDDLLEGGGGDDVYRFGRGDGADIILDDYWMLETQDVTIQYQDAETFQYNTSAASGVYRWNGTLTGVRTFTRQNTEQVSRTVQADGGSDVLELGAGIAATDIRLQISGDDLVLGILPTAAVDTAFENLTDIIRIQDWFNANNRIETVRLADGTEYDLTDIVSGDGTGTGPFVLVGSNGGEWIAGAGGNETLIGSAGNDVLIGGGGDDTIQGGDGDDTAQGGQGDDSIDGGIGNDTIVYAGGLADYLVTDLGGGAITVQDITGNDGTDSLSNIETVRFADETMAIVGGIIMPIARNDSVTGVEDTPVTLSAASLLGNDIEFTGATLSIAAVTNGTGGTASLDGNGDVLFTPDADFNGTASFDYTLTDGNGGSDDATVTVSVSAVNDAPVVAGAVTLVAIDEDTVLVLDAADLLGTATDIDGDTLSVGNLAASAGALADLGGGSWRYTPDADFNGGVTFSYDVTDGAIPVAASAGLTVNAINDAPATVSVSGSTIDENSAGAIVGAVSVSDIDTGDTHSYTIDDNRFEIAGGQLKLVDGLSLDFETESSVSVNVTAVDQAGASVTQSHTININNINDAPTLSGPASLPVIAEGSAATITVAQLLANATDDDGDALSVQNLTASAGSLVDNGDGTWDLTPDPDFSGSVDLSFDVSDGTLTTAATATLDVTAVNDAPTAIALDNLTIAENLAGGIVGALSVSDVDAGDTHSYTVDDNRFEIAGGQLKLVDGISLDFETGATVALQITVTDSGGAQFVQPFTVTVADGNDTPVAFNDPLVATTNEDTPVTIAAADLLANDTDDDADTLTIAAVSNATGGAATLDGNGDVLFTPDADFNGQAGFSYVTSDGLAQSTAATATIAVQAVNDAPTALALDNNIIDTGVSGAIVGILTITDVDAGDSHAVTVDDPRFEVVNGTLKLRDGVAIDFELEQSVAIGVTATDIAGASVTENFVIDVNNVTFDDPVGGNGSDSDDNLAGGNNFDALEGGMGNDVLAGGEGFDRLDGGAGDDVYLFNRGDGADVFHDNYRYEADVVHSFTYSQTAVTASQGSRTGSHSTPNHDGEGNVVSYTTRHGEVTVIEQQATTTTETYDTTITETVTGDGGNDAIAFGAGIVQSDILLQASGNDLLVGVRTNAGDTFADLTDVIRIRDWNNPDNRIETLRFADSSTMDLTAAAAPLFVAAGGAAVAAAADHDRIDGTAGADTLSGGGGNDLLRGGGGGDLYQFGRGGGADIIHDDYWIAEIHNVSFQYQDFETFQYAARVTEGPFTWSGTLTGSNEVTRQVNETVTDTQRVDGGNDVLELGAGIAALDVRLSVAGNDLLVGVTPQSGVDEAFALLSDVIRLQDWFQSDNRIEILRLADGTEYDLTDIVSNDGTGTGPFVLVGNNGGEWISGEIGDDTIIGSAGDDVIIGSLGHDILSGGDGNDLLQGGQGSDSLDGGTGIDTAYFDAGYQNYAIARAADGSVTVRDLAGSEGTDILTGIEFLQFADATAEITPTGIVPIAADDVATTTEDTPLTILASGILANDIDFDGGVLSIASVAGSVGGTATVDINGDVLFTPDADFSGTGSFGYMAMDSDGAMANATVVVTILAANDAPTAISVTAASVAENDPGATVGAVSVADADTGDSHSYQLSDGRFEIVGGQLKLRDGISLDYEAGATVSVDITATDTGNASVTETIAVAVTDVADASQRADSLVGSAAADLLGGLAGDDSVLGMAGDDDLRGDMGSDHIKGGAGNDLYRFDRGDGADLIFDDYRRSDQAVYEFDYTHQIQTSWTESRTGTAQIANLDGEGNVVSYSTYSGPVQVTQQGTATADATYATIVAEEVQDDGGADELVFGNGIAASDVLLHASGNDLLVGVKSQASDAFSDLTDVIRIQDWFNDNNKIETIRFADNSTLDLSGVTIATAAGAASLYLAGTAGADTLAGGIGHDTLEGGDGADILGGGAGVDLLEGGGGDDVYQFGRGDGHDVIRDEYFYQEQFTEQFSYQNAEITSYSANVSNGPYRWSGTLTGTRSVTETGQATFTRTVEGDGGNDTLQFGAGIATDQLWFSQSGNDLVVRIIGTEDAVRLADWYDDDAGKIETFRTESGSTLASTSAQNLVNAMAAYDPPPLGETDLSTALESTLDPVIAENWQN